MAEGTALHASTEGKSSLAWGFTRIGAHVLLRNKRLISPTGVHPYGSYIVTDHTCNSIYLIARSGNCSEFEDEDDEFTIDGEGVDIALLPQPSWVVFAFSVRKT